MLAGPISTKIKRTMQDLPLNRVKSALWRDVVFINLSGTAPEFDVSPGHCGKDGQNLKQTSIVAGQIQCSLWRWIVIGNWPFENYCEAYHLPFIHPGLNSYSRLEDHYNILDEHSYAGQGSYVFQRSWMRMVAFPVFGGLSKKWDKAAEYCAFFPNVLFGVHKKIIAMRFC